MSAIEDEAALVQAALAGDRQSVDALLRHHYPDIHRLCRRMTGNDADAADAAQEALIAVARGLAAGRFDGKARFSTWAYRVATNSCIDELRRRRRRAIPMHDDALGDRRTTSGPVDSIDSKVADRIDVDAALLRIPPEFRAAVVLRDLCGLDYAEISEVLQVPLGTVRSRIARGRAALVPLLGNPDEAPDRPTAQP